MELQKLSNVGIDIDSSHIYYFKPREKEKKRRKSGWLLILLLLFLFLNTTLSYTYWDGNINPININDFNIGVGTTLAVYESITPADGCTLVPKGVFMGETDVDELLFSYTANLNKAGVLTVELTDSYINEDTDIYNLLVFDIYFDEPNETNQITASTPLASENINGDYAVTVFIKISLNMPENEEQYNFVKNASISFALKFTATELPEQTEE
ncbi:MAG: hypothetical protein AB7S44_01915 [Spirochaetales bacterium]